MPMVLMKIIPSTQRKDLCFRVRKFNGPLILNNGIYFFHRGGGSSRKNRFDISRKFVKKRYQRGFCLYPNIETT